MSDELPNPWCRGTPEERFEHIIDALGDLLDDSANKFASDPPEDRYIKKVEEMVDTLDLMRDEFQRISVSPGVTTEVQALCARATMKIEQRISVIEQRDRLERKFGVAQLTISSLRRQVSGLQIQIAGKDAALRQVPRLGDIIRWRSTGTEEERVLPRAQAKEIFEQCENALNNGNNEKTYRGRVNVYLRWLQHLYNKSMKNLVKPIMSFDEWLDAIDNEIENESQREEDVREHESERMKGLHDNQTRDGR